jgi:hypothetical protein
MCAGTGTSCAAAAARVAKSRTYLISSVQTHVADPTRRVGNAPPPHKTTNATAFLGQAARACIWGCKYILGGCVWRFRCISLGARKIDAQPHIGVSPRPKPGASHRPVFGCAQGVAWLHSLYQLGWHAPLGFARPSARESSCMVHPRRVAKNRSITRPRPGRQHSWSANGARTRFRVFRGGVVVPGAASRSCALLCRSACVCVCPWRGVLGLLSVCVCAVASSPVAAIAIRETSSRRRKKSAKAHLVKSSAGCSPPSLAPYFRLSTAHIPAGLSGRLDIERDDGRAAVVVEFALSTRARFSLVGRAVTSWWLGSNQSAVVQI